MTNVTPDHVLAAYASGAFPMAESRDAEALFWVAPEQRGILPLERFHLPRRLARTLKRTPYQITVDRAFGRIIRACASEEAGRQTTWINQEIVELYSELHRRGFAHSIECWDKGVLVGGLYGVAIGAAFFGESMFHFEDDASKLALVYLVARLIAGQYQLLDMQWLTDHLERFGGIEIPRHEYLKLLDIALRYEGDFAGLPYDTPSSGILQLITQTS
ncbi:MAG: leucyl/phenylalanyl-tRNA--protein transferase [Proteobacteria bacterium]|nr:leucyl/phenylalanyl-tRNA--protein transferase [Pseudomonadota bacterium]